jgi:hypothetical protein
MSKPVITAALQQRLREIFEANGVKPKTKTALKYEYFFVMGAHAAAGVEPTGAVTMYLLAGRSILDMKIEEVQE